MICKMEKTKSIKRPKGITIIAFFFILGAFSLISDIFLEASPFFMFFGKMYTGKTAYVMYGINVLIGLFLGIGLLKLKKYSWWGFIVLNCYGFVYIIINHFTTQTDNYN